MIIKAKAMKLVKIYCYVTEKFAEGLKYSCERMSNNNRPDLTDEEVMTIYLFTVHEEQRFNIKQIHRFAHEYLRSWFPNLGSYAAYNNRINALSEAFRFLAALLLSQCQPSDCNLKQSLLDSMPIISCSGKRSPKVARELTDRTFCSTKNLWYYGLKLHVLGFSRPSQMPFPEQMLITPASVNDLNVFKEAWSSIPHRTFYGDKIYHDKPFFKQLEEQQKSIMLTPVKALKGQSEWERNFSQAANDIYSKAVSTIRQPIESLFNWLIQKTDIQYASKVRSTKGLMVHVFGKITAAFIGLIF
jgi:hypothetical protein